jgi:hypothetical protein
MTKIKIKKERRQRERNAGQDGRKAMSVDRQGRTVRVAVENGEKQSSCVIQQSHFLV